MGMLAKTLLWRGMSSGGRKVGVRERPGTDMHQQKGCVGGDACSLLQESKKLACFFASESSISI